MSDVVIKVENLSKAFRPPLGKHYTRIAEKVYDLITNSGKREKTERERELFWALRDVSFDVSKGEVLGLIGRNGAGKSTLLKVLSRVTDPTEGSATIRGSLASLLEVGVGFHPELTGRENVFLNGAVLGMKKNEIQRKMNDIIEFAEVEKFIDHPIKRYSSGMYVRLAFAVAAHLEPDILIVDEALAVGDAAFQKKCLGKIGEVSKHEGRTVIFVSHDMAALNSLCGRAVIMDKGRVQLIGPVSEMVSRYLSEIFNFDSSDLENLRVRGYGIDCKFVDIRLKEGDGNLRFGDPIEVQTVVEATREIRGLSVGVTIMSRSGWPITTFFSDQSFDMVAGQKVRVWLRASQLNLVPGYYYMRCSLGRGGHDAARHDLDQIDGRPTFQVLPVSAGNEKLFNWKAESLGHIKETRVESGTEVVDL